MKTRIFPVVAGILALSSFCLDTVVAQTIRFNSRSSSKEVDLKWLLETKEIWAMTPDDFEHKAGRNKFVWQDAERTRARFNPEAFKLKIDSQDTGETLVNFKDGKVSSITFSIVNKGDDYLVDKSSFTEALTSVTKLLQGVAGEKIREEKRPRNEQVTKANGSLWRAGHALFLLEHLFLEEETFSEDGWTWKIVAHAEFLRIRVLPPSKKLGEGAIQAKATGTRAQLTAKVKHEGKKAVIEGIPMVDQGPKGYCAVASFERVLRFYGADVDMHDLANLANTYGGTNPAEMKDAIHKIAVKLGMTTREPVFMKEKNYIQLCDAYNRAAKKAGKTEVEASYGMFQEMDAQTLKEVRTKGGDFAKFKAEIVSSVNKGVPLLWGLHLGMFWEDKLEESYEANRYAKSDDLSKEDEEDAKAAKDYAESEAEREAEMRKKPRPPSYMQGGHMRLIIGYDGETGVIFYTDSWGPGHEMKKMPIEEAFTGTQALMILEPR